MSEWQNKCWGKTRDIYCDKRFLRQELILKSNTNCSVHYHERRCNRFILKAGEVYIVIFNGSEYKTIRLQVDEPFVVGAKILHCFVVVHDGMMIEEYFSEDGGDIDKEDIVRLCEGGVCDASDVERLVGSLMTGFKDAK